MKTLLILSSVVALAVLLAACGSKEESTEGKVIKSVSAGNNLTVSLASDSVLKRANTEFTLTFTDASGKTVDVGAVALIFHMPQMGTMAEMNDAASFTTTETPGVYRGRANVQMGGEWQVRITYEGPQGRGQASFPVPVQ
ncbi:MAG TPA: FixH family protein [Pyrinomonadaceae bacterium]|nr:FixH family protein [Pyrinomonadaceae bacterium]